MTEHTRIPVTDTNHTKVLPQRVFNEILNEGRLEVADEIVAPSFRLHSPTRPEPFEGPEGFKQFVADLRRGFPDLKVTIDQTISEGEIVSIRSHVSGTHLGKYRGIPPTGRRIAQSQLHMFRVADGHIQETWQEIDGLGIMQQLKIFPPGNPPTFLLRFVIGIQKLARIR
jgi:steroid delta-isomerase-like uncharacterized protein